MLLDMPRVRALAVPIAALMNMDREHHACAGGYLRDVVRCPRIPSLGARGVLALSLTHIN